MSFWSDYDRWKTTNPAEERANQIVCQCPSCDADIYVGQEVVKYDGDYYCDTDCVLDMIGCSHENAEFDEPDYDGREDY